MRVGAGHIRTLLVGGRTHRENICSRLQVVAAVRRVRPQMSQRLLFPEQRGAECFHRVTVDLLTVLRGRVPNEL